MSNYSNEEIYVTGKQAHKLLSLGYPAETVRIGGLEGFPCSYIAPPSGYKGLWPNNIGIKHPLQSAIQKWIREEKRVYLFVNKNFGVEEYFYKYESPTTYVDSHDVKVYKSYEEALSAGIDDVLEYLNTEVIKTYEVTWIGYDIKGDITTKGTTQVQSKESEITDIMLSKIGCASIKILDIKAL